MERRDLRLREGTSKLTVWNTDGFQCEYGKGCGMIVTLNEFKSEVERYLKLVGEEEILITEDGENIARISAAPKDKAAIIYSLRGILPSDITKEEAREARLAKYEDSL